MKIRTQFDKEYKGVKGEVFKEKSLTIPDQTLTVRQLFLNHTRGIKSEVYQPEKMYFDFEIPQLDDLTSMQEWKNAIMGQVEETQKMFDLDAERTKEEMSAKEAAKLDEINKFSDKLKTALKGFTKEDLNEFLDVKSGE